MQRDLLFQRCPFADTALQRRAVAERRGGWEQGESEGGTNPTKSLPGTAATPLKSLGALFLQHVSGLAWALLVWDALLPTSSRCASSASIQ